MTEVRILHEALSKKIDNNKQMFKLILVDKGQAPLQVVKCLMDHCRISLSIAMELVRQNEPTLHESENEQDILDLEEKLKKFGAVTKVIND